jgi:parvulin-like peptidyl-prolyl isomerase
MMQTMRRLTKVIFLVVLVAFVGFMAYGGVISILSGKSKTQGGSAPPGVIGIVNGEQLSQYTFDDAYRKRIQSITKTDTITGEVQEPTDQETEQARNDVWNSMTTMALLEQEAEKHGILVTDAEVADYMRQAPPQDIVQSKSFATDGKFDITKYQTWLQQLASSPDPRYQAIITDFESQIHRQLLVSRLQDFVLSTIKYDRTDAKNDYIEKNQKVDVQYILIPAGDFDSTITTVPESEIRARYDKDRDQYKQPEMATISYVQITKSASAADSAAAKAAIDSIYAQLRAGANFDTLAVERSEDPGSAKKGGDLGWFSEGRMVKEFWEATAKLKKIGEISEPFASQYGWHIVKLTGKRMTKGPDGKETPEYQASHILILSQPSAQTLADLEQKANNFKAEAETIGLKEAAQEYGLKLIESKPFAKGSFIPGIGQNQKLSDFAFEAKPGDLSDVISGRADYLICQLVKRTPPGYSPFDDIKNRIKETILHEMRVDAAHRKGDELAAEMAQGKTFDDIVAETGKPVQTTDFFSQTGFVRGVGSDPDFIGAAFSLSPTKPVSKAVQSRNGTYFLKFVGSLPADTTKFAAQADSLSTDFINTKKRDLWNKWLGEIRQHAKIEDFRSVYYGA